ncbi:MAG TPA: hypothetical protein VGG04_19170 [Candidatus Sulfotelmatobacter sp.]|jgi:hypothetical protein
MSVRKIISIFFGLVLACGVLLPAARADEWSQRTEVSFNQPIALPHVTLPAGTYWFVLASGSNRNVVEIYNQDWSKLFTTSITVPTERAQSTNRTEIVFAERPSSQPEAILKWYYPGRLTGHEFLYRARRESAFTRDVKQDAVALKIRS